MVSTQNFTALETALVKQVMYNDDYSGGIMFNINDVSCMEKEVAKGVMGSLEKKWIISDTEHRGDGNCVCWHISYKNIERITGVDLSWE